jgi:hypothetical protein
MLGFRHVSPMSLSVASPAIFALIYRSICMSFRFACHSVAMRRNLLSIAPRRSKPLPKMLLARLIHYSDPASRLELELELELVLAIYLSGMG